MKVISLFSLAASFFFLQSIAPFSASAVNADYKVAIELDAGAVAKASTENYYGGRLISEVPFADNFAATLGWMQLQSRNELGWDQIDLSAYSAGLRLYSNRRDDSFVVGVDGEYVGLRALSLNADTWRAGISFAHRWIWDSGLIARVGIRLTREIGSDELDPYRRESAGVTSLSFDPGGDAQSRTGVHSMAGIGWAF